MNRYFEFDKKVFYLAVKQKVLYITCKELQLWILWTQWEVHFACIDLLNLVIWIANLL